MNLTAPEPLLVGSPQFPEFDSGVPHSSLAVLDAVLANLQAHKQEWANLAVQERIGILDEIFPRLAGLGQDWVRASLQAKQVSEGGFAEMEEWILYSGVVSLVKRYRRILMDISRYGAPRLPGKLKVLPNGQVAAPIFPADWPDHILFAGVKGEVWLEPGVQLNDAIEIQEPARDGQPPRGKLALVLAAGNASMLPAADLLSKLYGENQIVLLKMNPVNAYLGPLIENAFEPLIQRGFLSIVYGGPEIGTYLCSHPAVDALHLTGSDKTHDAIVYGSGPEGASRKASRQPLIDKPFTAELGGVNPLIIVPGPWTDQQIRQKAAQLAGFLYSNASFSCLTPRLIIQQREWPGRAAFVRELGKALETAGTRPAYYPGAQARHSAFLAAYPDALQIGEAQPPCLPWTILADLPPDQENSPAFLSESFCSIIGETALPEKNPAEFINQAVEFANQNLWGNLTATFLVHTSSLKDPKTAGALEDALAHLRYGSIQINTYPAAAYTMYLSPWGAYPGNPPHDIQSGSGFVTNLYRLRKPQKVIFRAPFQAIDPVIITSKSLARFGRSLAAFRLKSSLVNLIPLLQVSLESK